MSENSNVFFKATRDNIIVMLSKTSDFYVIKEDLRERVSKAKKFFGNSKASLVFKGRMLSEDEERQLLEIILEETNLIITSVLIEESKQVAVGETISDNIQQSFSVVENNINSIMKWNNNNSIFHKGNVRSGVELSNNGSIIVIGDVNPGGRIIADGNIVVLGSLKGSAHAGALGNSDCFVAALNLMPTQLRIANIVTSLADEYNEKRFRFRLNIRPESIPSYAFVQDEQIYIAPLV